MEFNYLCNKRYIASHAGDSFVDYGFKGFTSESILLNRNNVEWAQWCNNRLADPATQGGPLCCTLCVSTRDDWAVSCPFDLCCSCSC